MLFVFASRTSWDTNNTTVGGFSAGGNLSLGQASLFHSRIRAVSAENLICKSTATNADLQPCILLGR